MRKRQWHSLNQNAFKDTLAEISTHWTLIISCERTHFDEFLSFFHMIIQQILYIISTKMGNGRMRNREKYLANENRF